MPDLLIMEPDTYRKQDGRIRNDDMRWSDTKVAVEVEASPGKHRENISHNWKKNDDYGYKVWFIVFNEKDYRIVEECMEEAKINRKKYRLDLWTAEDVINRANIPDTPWLKSRYIAEPPGKVDGDEAIRGTVPSKAKSSDPARNMQDDRKAAEPPKQEAEITVPLNYLEAIIFENIGDGIAFSPKALIEKCKLMNYSEKHVRKTAYNMVKKGVLEFGNQIVKKKMDMLDGDGERKDIRSIPILQKKEGIKVLYKDLSSVKMPNKEDEEYVDEVMKDDKRYVGTVGIGDSDKEAIDSNVEDDPDEAHPKDPKVDDSIDSHKRDKVKDEFNFKEMDDDALRAMLIDAGIDKKYKKSIEKELEKRGNSSY